MDCKEANRLLYALADGELADPDCAAVQAHVETCPACRSRVDVQRELKRRIRKAADNGPAPASLRSALAVALAEAAGDPVGGRPGYPAEAGPASASGPEPRVIPIRRWIASFAAMAAMVALIVVAYVRWPADGENAGGGQVPTVTFTDTSPTAVALADRLYEVHMAGQKAGKEHQDPGLPKAGREAALAMSRDLNSTVLWCGRLASLTGQFERADYCELVDAKGQKHRGAHLLFRSPQGAVSLVSFPKLEEMAELKKVHHGSRDYAILCPSKCGGGRPTTIVGFDCPVGSHFVCAPLEPAKLVDMTEPMQPVHAKATAAIGSRSLAFRR